MYVPITQACASNGTLAALYGFFCTQLPHSLNSSGTLNKEVLKYFSGNTYFQMNELMMDK